MYGGNAAQHQCCALATVERNAALCCGPASRMIRLVAQMHAAAGLWMGVRIERPCCG